MTNQAMTTQDTDRSGYHPGSFFSLDLAQGDPDIHQALREELARQQDGIELIASENIVSRQVLQATGTVLANKYAEGYPSKRYYAGCVHVDVVEKLAIERAKELFGCSFANVQPHSGSQANQAVFMALMKPGSTFLAMALEAGGHLTHGAAPNQSGKWFNAIHYGLDKRTGHLDYDQLAELARAHRPEMIIAGGSAYARFLDFERFRQIADEVGAYLLVDMAHFAGLVAGGVHPSPIPFADVVTTTTHKTLRCARGGMILTNQERLAKKIDSAIFPGLQGGPLLQMMAGKAVGLREALDPSFKTYARAVVANAAALADELMRGGLSIVSGGTDTHLMLVDLRPKGVTGAALDQVLEQVGLTCNKNAVPDDPEPPTVTSGIRLGTPAATTRGFGEAEFRQVARFILRAVDAIVTSEGEAALHQIHDEVRALCARFPIYADF